MFITASRELSVAVRFIILEDMIEALRAEPVDLNDINAVKLFLKAEGFGQPSIDALAESAQQGAAQ